MFHPVGTKGSVAGYLRYAVAVFPQNQCARALILRNGCNPCLHIRNNLVAGNTVEVPNHITRVVIDQIPILSTYMSYFGGEAPYIVGYCGSFKDTISKTVLKNIAPELMESADTVYAQSDLNIEEIMKLEPDVILYNAGNTAHAEILQESGIPCIGFATVGHETEADP